MPNFGRHLVIMIITIDMRTNKQSQLQSSDVNSGNQGYVYARYVTKNSS